MIAIAHFQKEWQTVERMGARSIMGSFGATIVRALRFFAHARALELKLKL